MWGNRLARRSFLLSVFLRPIRCTSGRRKVRTALSAHLACSCGRAKVAGGPLADTHNVRCMKGGAYVCSTFSQNARRSRQPPPSSYSTSSTARPPRPPERTTYLSSVCSDIRSAFEQIGLAHASAPLLAQPLPASAPGQPGCTNPVAQWANNPSATTPRHAAAMIEASVARTKPQQTSRCFGLAAGTGRVRVLACARVCFAVC